MVQALQQAGTYLPIEDHGIIGDLHTVALVGKNGTIDWCCMPAFDAPSIFGSLLDTDKGGFFSIAPPTTPELAHKQYYLPETNILITRFFTHEGVGEITDFMPIQPAKEHTQHHRIIRAVRVVQGQLTFELICRPAFNYARDTHSVQLSERGAVFQHPELSLGLFASTPLEEDGHGGMSSTFTLQQDHWAYFLLESTGDQESEPPHLAGAVSTAAGGDKKLLAHLACAVSLPGPLARDGAALSPGLKTLNVCTHRSDCGRSYYEFAREYGG